MPSTGTALGTGKTPKKLLKLLQPSFPDADLEVLAKVAARYKEIDAWAATPVFTEESYNRLLDVMQTAGELNKRPPYTKLVTNEFAEKQWNSYAKKAERREQQKQKS